METICDYLVFDHRRCDALFERADTCIEQRDWSMADTNFRQFQLALKQHMKMEEKILFPAFENFMSNSAAPLAMLRREHGLIHGIVERMALALNRMDPVSYGIHAETLTLLIQQHGMKEEEMLYPLLDKILSARRDEIIQAMRQYITPTPD